MVALTRMTFKQKGDVMNRNIKLALATIGIVGYAIGPLNAADKTDIYKGWIDVSKGGETMPIDKDVTQKDTSKKDTSKKKEKKAEIPAWEEKAREKTADIGIEALKKILTEGISLAGKAGSEAITQYFKSQEKEAELVQTFQRGVIKMIEKKVNEISTKVSAATATELDSALKKELTDSIKNIKERLSWLNEMMQTKKLPAKWAEGLEQE